MPLGLLRLIFPLLFCRCLRTKPLRSGEFAFCDNGSATCPHSFVLDPGSFLVDAFLFCIQLGILDFFLGKPDLSLRFTGIHLLPDFTQPGFHNGVPIHLHPPGGSRTSRDLPFFSGDLFHFLFLPV